MTDAQARYDQTAGVMMTPAKMAALAAGLTVGALFQQQVMRNGSRNALEGNGRTLNYTSLGERVRRLACALAARGIGRGDRIALLSENRPEYLELQLAAATLGVILACQNWRQADPELQHCIRLVPLHSDYETLAVLGYARAIFSRARCVVNIQLIRAPEPLR